MPTYEYECTACGHLFEVFQNMSDKPVRKCPECGKRVRRLISGGGAVIIRGGGSGSERPFACGRNAPCRGDDSPCLHSPHDD